MASIEEQVNNLRAEMEDARKSTEDAAKNKAANGASNAFSMPV